MILIVNYKLVVEVISIIYMYNNICFSFSNKHYPLNCTNYLFSYSNLMIYLVQFSNHAIWFWFFFFKCLLKMMVKPLGIKVDSNYQAFHHWFVHFLQEKWYFKVSFGGHFGATDSLQSDWLQHVEIEGLILWF